MKHFLILLGAALLLLASCGRKADLPAAEPQADSLLTAVCSADEALALARQTGAVVMEGLKCTSGRDAWDAFCAKADRGEPASVLCVRYYTLDPEGVSEELYEEEKDQYPKLFVQQLVFDGERYSVTSRASTEEEPESAETYPCLRHFTGKGPATALFTNYEYYVLTDEADVTWEEIERGMFSSQSGDWIRHFTVFSNID